MANKESKIKKALNNLSFEDKLALKAINQIESNQAGLVPS